MADVEELTELCVLANKYGTDKCPQLKHNYTPFYYNLLKDRRESVKKILEFGVGYVRGGGPVGEPTFDRKLRRFYRRGASLYMWRDFFPNAQIYGADIQPEAMFSDDRITTYLCDGRNKEQVEGLIREIGSDIDLFVDDGSHLSGNQIHLCEFAMPLLNKGVIYVIEDVAKGNEERITSFLGEYDYEVHHLSSPGNRRSWVDSILIIIRHK